MLEQNLFIQNKKKWKHDTKQTFIQEHANTHAFVYTYMHINANLLTHAQSYRHIRMSQFWNDDCDHWQHFE